MDARIYFLLFFAIQYLSANLIEEIFNFSYSSVAIGENIFFALPKTGIAIEKKDKYQILHTTHPVTSLHYFKPTDELFFITDDTIISLKGILCEENFIWKERNEIPNPITLEVDNIQKLLFVSNGTDPLSTTIQCCKVHDMIHCETASVRGGRPSFLVADEKNSQLYEYNEYYKQIRVYNYTQCQFYNFNVVANIDYEVKLLLLYGDFLIALGKDEIICLYNKTSLNEECFNNTRITNTFSAFSRKRFFKTGECFERDEHKGFYDNHYYYYIFGLGLLVFVVLMCLALSCFWCCLEKKYNTNVEYNEIPLIRENRAEIRPVFSSGN